MRVDCRVAVLEPKRGSPQVLACGSAFFTATLTPARPVWGKLRQGGPATQWMKVPNGCQPATGISGIVRAAATETAADGTCSTQQLIEGALARDPTRPKDPPLLVSAGHVLCAAHPSGQCLPGRLGGHPSYKPYPRGLGWRLPTCRAANWSVQLQISTRESAKLDYDAADLDEESVRSP